MAEGSDEEQVMDVALEAGAEDIVTHDDGTIEVNCPVESYHELIVALDAADLVTESTELLYRAANEISLDEAAGEKVLKLVDALEDLDDVQDVHTNADFPEALFN
jgi:transcriptional/translational regulatory protein YebC/TACO1